MPSKETVVSQIKSLLVNHPNINIDILFKYIPEFHTLHELIKEDEVIKGYCMGLLEGSKEKYLAGEWLVVLTNQRFIFVHKSFIKTSHDQFSLEFSHIQKITTKMGWFFGQIQFQTEPNTIKMIQIGKKNYEFFLPCLKDFL